MNTKNKLRIVLERKEYPFPKNGFDEKGWGEFSFIYYDIEVGKELNLLTWQWDLPPFKEWFLENYNFLKNEPLVFDGQTSLPNESIAQALNRLIDYYGEEVDRKITDRWEDLLFAYREKHGIRFGFQGTTMPPIYIGINRGVGEISVASKVEWSYIFDMDDFIEDTLKQLDQLNLTDEK